MKKLFTLFCLLTYSFINYGQTTYFDQDFLANTTVANYIGNPASINQFTENPAGVTTTITSGRYQIAKVVTTAVNYRFGRYVDFASEPKSLYCQFNFGVTTAAAVTKNGAIALNLGAGYDATIAPTTANTYAKLIFNLIAGGLTFQLNDGTTNSANFTGNQNITFVMNNTGATFTYVAPDGTNETLGNDLFDVWVGTTRVFNERPVTTATQSIKRFRFDVAHDAAIANSPTISFDNFLMRDVTGSLLVNTNVATPDSMLVKYIGASKNVGLGTTTPGAKLEVNPTTTNTSGVRLTQLKSTSPAAAANGKVLSVNANGDIVLVKDSLGAGGGFTLPVLTSGSLLFSNGTTIAQNNSKLFWDNTNFRLGVGTVTPAQSLDVVGGAKISGLSGTGNRMVVTDATGNLTSQAIPAGAVADNLGNHSATQNIALNGFALTNNGTGGGMNVTNTGSVGIGTATPTTKLTIQDLNPTLRLETTQSPTGYYTEMTSLYDGAQPFVLKVGPDKLLGIKRLGVGNLNTQSYINGRYGIGFTTETGEPDSTNLKMLIATNGNVGIGTYSKVFQTLNINGGIGFANQNNADKKLYSPTDGDLEWLTNNLAAGHGFAISSNGTKAVYLNTLGNSYLNGGNVGIGTTTPQTKLDVRGSILAGNTDYVNGTSGSVLQIQQGTSSGNTYSEIGAFVSGGSAWGNLVLNRGGGNVGIGTTTPTNKLEINGTGSGLRFTNLKSTSLTSSYTGKVLTVDANGDVVLVKDSIGTVGAGANAWALSGNNISNTNSGNVGIGTTPTSKLDVAGTITTGSAASTEGVDALSMRYTTNETINNWGSLRSSSASYIGYGVKASPTVGNGFISSTASTVIGKAAFTTGWNGGGFQFATAPAQSSAVGSAITLNPLMSITNDGNVGIGTIIPTAKLDIQGATGLKIASTDGVGITFKGRIQDNSSQLRFHDNGNVLSSILGHVGNELRFYTGGTTGIDPLPRMVVTNGGFVGVGTGGPISTFHTTGNLTVGSGVNGSAIATLQLRSDGTTPIANKLTYGTDGTGWGFAIGKNQGGVVTDQFFVKDNGNVGIGTATPTEKLEVNGIAKINSQLFVGDKFSSSTPLNVNQNTGYPYSAVFAHSDQTINRMLIVGQFGNEKVMGLQSSVFTTGNLTSLSLNPSGGNVGIGTTNPTEKLTVLHNGLATPFGAFGVDVNSFSTTANAVNSYFFRVRDIGAGTTPFFINGAGLIGIGTATPNAKLDIASPIGTSGLRLSGLTQTNIQPGPTRTLGVNDAGEVVIASDAGITTQKSDVNGYKTFFTNEMSAAAQQAKRFEVARIFTNTAQWSATGPVEIELQEIGYADGGSRKYKVHFGYIEKVGSLSQLEVSDSKNNAGVNNFQLSIGIPVIDQILNPTGTKDTIRYIPIYADVKYYATTRALIKTSRPSTPNNNGGMSGTIYVNSSPTGINISDFVPNNNSEFSIAGGNSIFKGNVGIGTTTPSQKLEIRGNSGSPATSGTVQNGIVAISSNDTYSTLHMGNNIASPYGFWLQAGGRDNLAVNYPLLLNQNGGNVGIGTASPQAKLHVGYNGTGYSSILSEANESAFSLYTKTISTSGASAEAFRLGLKYNTNENNGFVSFYRGVDSGGGSLGFSSNGVERMRISSEGNVGIGTSNPLVKLSVNSDINQVATFKGTAGIAQLSLNNNTDKGISLFTYKSTYDAGSLFGVGPNGSGIIQEANAPLVVGTYDVAQPLLFGTNSAERMRISTEGNVGIGTTTPAEKLQIAGDILAAYRLAFQDNARFNVTKADVPTLNTDNFSMPHYGIATPNTTSSADLWISGNNGIRMFTGGNPKPIVNIGGGKLEIASASGSGLKLSGLAGTTTRPLSVNALGEVIPGEAVIANPSANAWTVTGSNISNSVLAGNVGIGTVNPVSKLDVFGGVLGNATGNKLEVARFVTTNGNASYLRIYNNRHKPGGDWYSASTRIQQTIDATDMGYLEFNPNNGPLGLALGGHSGEIMRLSDAGNVGIGITTPSSKLQVFNGKIIAGTTNATTGSVVLESQYDQGGTSGALSVLGTNYSTGGWMLGYGISPKPDVANSYVSSTTGNLPRTAIMVEGELRFMTADQQALAIGSNITMIERMKITNNGNVGIGTTTPTTKLDVLGTARVSSQLYLGNSVNSPYLMYGAIPNTYTFGDNNSYFMNINTTNGNVGIGTTNPYSKLQLFGYGIANGINVGDRTDNPNTVGSNIYVTNTNNGILSIKVGKSTVGYGTIALNEDGGNVSIGTINAPTSYKLAVAGDMIAERVVVKLQSSGWPDYVFTPNYHLSTLPEVEKYIEQNHHLPNVPSAKEVADKGIDVGAMNTKFMEKIEELTLYLIEQNKKLEALEKKNVELENAIKNIKK